jgi:hypothetical protein
LQEIEDNLRIELRYRNPQLRAWAPIPMVNEIASVGDVAPGRPHIRARSTRCELLPADIRPAK